MFHPPGICAFPARCAPLALAPLACAALATASPAAQALEASAVLDWSRFSIHVVDIDAHDGIDARYAFDSTSSRAALCLDNSLGCPHPQGPSAEDWTSHGSARDAVDTVWGGASYSAHALKAEGGGRSHGGERSVTASRSALLMLEGASEVTITIPYTLSVNAEGGDPLHSSFAYAGLIVSSVGIANSQLSTREDGTASSTEFLRLQWTNYSDFAVSYMGADAFARLDCASSVPEPMPLAMMAGGAALLGIRWRKRQSLSPGADHATL
jgi:hypothetical protein